MSFEMYKGKQRGTGRETLSADMSRLSLASDRATGGPTPNEAFGNYVKARRAMDELAAPKRPTKAAATFNEYLQRTTGGSGRSLFATKPTGGPKISEKGSSRRNVAAAGEECEYRTIARNALKTIIVNGGVDRHLYKTTGGETGLRILHEDGSHRANLTPEQTRELMRHATGGCSREFETPCKNCV